MVSHIILPQLIRGCLPLAPSRGSLSESPINSGESNDEDGTTRKGNLQAAHGGIKLYNRWLCRLLEIRLGEDEGAFLMIDLVIRLRRFKSRKSLERVAPRMLDRASSAGLQEELKVIAAIDHRKAEIAAGRLYDAGKVPMTAWALVD